MKGFSKTRKDYKHQTPINFPFDQYYNNFLDQWLEPFGLQINRSIIFKSEDNLY